VPDTPVVGRPTAQPRSNRETGLAVQRRFTDRSDGDLSVLGPPDQLGLLRSNIAPAPWTWLHQVHGDRVVVVTTPGEHAGADADAAVTAVPGAVLAVHTADCAGVLLRAETGAGVVVGAAHAGWRGLESGVLQATVAAMRDLGAQQVAWELGPCISPGAYEFGEGDLDRLVQRYGPTLRGTTTGGERALDLRAGVAAALAETGATAVLDEPLAVRCTASDPDCFSWRARRDRGRQAAVTWIDARPIGSDLSTAAGSTTGPGCAP